MAKKMDRYFMEVKTSKSGKMEIVGLRQGASSKTPEPSMGGDKVLPITATSYYILSAANQNPDEAIACMKFIKEVLRGAS